MTVRTTSKTVTFMHPFNLSGIDEVQPAGTYTVETDEELLRTSSLPAYRRISSCGPSFRGHPVRMGAPGRGDFHTALRTEGFERRGALLGVAVKPNENTHASLLSAGRSRDSKGVGCGSDYPSSRHISRLPARACFPGCCDMKTRSLHTHAPKSCRSSHGKTCRSVLGIGGAGAAADDPTPAPRRALRTAWEST